MRLLKKHKRHYTYFFLIVGIFTLMAVFTTPYMTVATLAYSLLCLGLRFRKNRRTHAIFMSSGILLDLMVVLILEFQREAIATALAFTLNPFQQAHIGTSALAILFYFPTVVLGVLQLNKIVRGSRIRKWHIRLGVTAFLFRTAGFLLMFSMLSHHH